LPDLEKKKFILVSGEKIYLDSCDQNLESLFKILGDEIIPFKEKEKIAYSILARLVFIFC